MNTVNQPNRRRGCLFFIARGLSALVIIVMALVLLGVSYQTIATQQDIGRFSPRGQLYTVNGHQMHMVCMGEGSPTVILQAGISADALWWYHVQNQLAPTTQVCAYDRPGLGWSEPVDGLRAPLTIASELHSLLQEAGISAPYVLAGHSYGAIWTRIYAAQYPEEVAGIVLVDSSLVTPEQFASQAEYDSWKSSTDGLQALVWATMRLGLVRLTDNGTFTAMGYPPEIVPEMVALHSRNQTFDTSYAEQVPVMREITEASAAAKDFGVMPLFILWASETETMMQNVPALTSLHNELATYSSNTAIHIVEGASHGSILGNEQQAQQVTDAILAVIASAETGEPLSVSE